MFKKIIAPVLGGFIILVLAVSISSIALAKNNDKGHIPITICHRTGSESNPYVTITIDQSGLNGHMHHQGDIIPAPAGGCPGRNQPTPTPTPTCTPTPTPTLTSTPCCQGGVTSTPTPQVLGTSAPVVTQLPQTGADSSIYYLVFMGALASTFLMKKYVWQITSR